MLLQQCQVEYEMCGIDHSWPLFIHLHCKRREHTWDECTYANLQSIIMDMLIVKLCRLYSYPYLVCNGLYSVVVGGLHLNKIFDFSIQTEVCMV